MPAEIASVYATIGADTSGLERGLKKTEQGLGGIGGAAKKAMGGVGALLGPMGIAGAVAGAGALVGKSISQAAAFEAAINTLRVAVGDTGPDIKDLSKVALQMGADTQLVGIDAMQSAEAMENFAKAGLSAADMFGGANGLNDYLKEGTNLSGAMRAAVDLAAASELDMAAASDVISIAMATFGIEAEDAIKITDNFVKAADASVTSVPELAAALANVGPTFAAFGWGLDDVNNALALLSQRGISGAEAGTALKSMMTNMMSGSKKVTSSLGALNVELYDQAGNMRELPDILGQLEAGLAGVSEEERNMRIQTIAGTYGMKAMNTLLAGGVAGWTAMEGATAKASSAQEVAQARTEGFGGAMEALEGSIQTLMIRAGTPLIKHVLTPMVGWLAKVIGKIAMVDFGTLGTSIKSFVTDAGAKALTLFGNVTTAIGNIPAAITAWSEGADGMVGGGAFLAALGLPDDIESVLQTRMDDVEIVWNRLLDGFIGNVTTAVGNIPAAITAWSEGEDGMVGGGAFLAALGLPDDIESVLQTRMDDVEIVWNRLLDGFGAAKTGAEEGGVLGGASAFISALGLPDTLEATLQTRIDALGVKKDALIAVAKGVEVALGMGRVSSAAAMILRTLGVPPGITLTIANRIKGIDDEAAVLITTLETHIASLEGESFEGATAKILTALGVPEGLATTIAARVTSIKTEIDKLPGYVEQVKLATRLGGFKSGTEAFLQVIGLPASTAIDIAARLTTIKTEVEKLPGYVSGVVATVKEQGWKEGAATLLADIGLPTTVPASVETRIGEIKGTLDTLSGIVTDTKAATELAGFAGGTGVFLASIGLPLTTAQNVADRITAIKVELDKLPGYVTAMVTTLGDEGLVDGAATLLIEAGLPADAVTTVQARVKAVGDELAKLPGFVETAVTTVQEKGWKEGATTLLADIGLPTTVATEVAARITTITTELAKLPASLATALATIQTEGVEAGITSLLTSIGIDDTTAGTISAISADIVDAVDTFAGDIVAGVSGAYTKITTGDIAGGLAELGTTLAEIRPVTALLDLGQSILTTLEQEFPALGPAVDNVFKPLLGIGSRITGTIGGLDTEIVTLIEQLVKDVETGLGGSEEADLGELIFGSLGGAVDLLDTITADILPLIETFATDIREFLNDEFKVLIEWFADNLPLINETLDTLKAKWAEVWPTLSAVMSVELELIQGIIDVALKGVLGLITAAMFAINGEWGSAWDAIKDTGAEVSDATREAFEDMESAAEKSFGGIEKQRAKFGDLHAVTAVSGEISPADIAKLQADLSATLHPVTAVDMEEFTPPIEAIGVAWEGAKVKADEYVTSIEGWADGLVTELETAGTAVATFKDDQIAALKTAMTEAKDDVGKWKDSLVALKDEIATGIGTKLTWISDTALPAVTTAFDDAKLLVFQTIEILQALKDEITTGIGAKLDSLKDKLEPIKKGFEGIQAAVTTVKDGFGLLQAAADKLKLPDFLTPGSATPAEVGFRGIADAVILVSREFLKMAGSLDANRLKKIGNAFKNMGKGIDRVVDAMSKMQAMGAMGAGGGGGGLALGGIAAMWDQFEQVAHFVMGKIASVVDAMGGTKWGARRIKELRKTAARLRDIIDFVMVDLSSIKTHDLSDIGVWGEQLHGAILTMLSVLQRINEAFGERALKVAKDIAVNVGGVLGLLDQSLEFEINTSPTFVEDIKMFVAQIKTVATGEDGLSGLVGWLGFLGNSARQAIKDAAAAAVDVKALVGLLGMSLQIEELQEGWAEALPKWLGRMEFATNLIVPMLDRLHVAWGQAEEGAKSLLEQGSITAGHVAGVLTLMSQKMEVGEVKEGFLGALQTHLNHVGMALTKIVPALEWIRTHFVSELDPEVNRLDEVQGIAAKITDALGVMGAGLEAKVPAEGFLGNLQVYLNHVGAALTKIVPVLEWVRDHFVSKVDPAINRLDEVQGVASNITNVLGVLGQSLKFEMPDAADFGGQLDKFLAFMELAADKTIGMVQKLRDKWDPNGTAENTVLGQLAQASQDVQSVLGVLGIDFWKGGEGLGFAEGGGVLEDQVDWLMDDISLAMDMLMDPSDPRSLPSLNSKWGDAMTEAKTFATNLKSVFDAIAGAVKSASEALKTGLDATAMGKLTTSLATAAAAAGQLAQVPSAGNGNGNGAGVGPNPMARGPGGASGAPVTEHVVKFRFMDGENLLQELTLRLADILQADQDFYIDAALQGAMH